MFHKSQEINPKLLREKLDDLFIFDKNNPEKLASLIQELAVFFDQVGMIEFCFFYKTWFEWAKKDFTNSLNDVINVIKITPEICRYWLVNDLVPNQFDSSLNLVNSIDDLLKLIKIIPDNSRSAIIKKFSNLFITIEEVELILMQIPEKHYRYLLSNIITQSSDRFLLDILETCQLFAEKNQLTQANIQLICRNPKFAAAAPAASLDGYSNQGPNIAATSMDGYLNVSRISQLNGPGSTITGLNIATSLNAYSTNQGPGFFLSGISRFNESTGSIIKPDIEMTYSESKP
jgi:hypothetical protein